MWVHVLLSVGVGDDRGNICLLIAVDSPPKSIATRMVCGVRAQQISSVRLCTFPAYKPLYGCCRLPSRRSISLSLSCKKGTTVGLSSSDTQSELSENEIQRRLNKAVGLINTADLLAPFDRSSYSAPLVIWCAKPWEKALWLLDDTRKRCTKAVYDCRQAIADIPAAHRSKVLSRLSSK